MKKDFNPFQLATVNITFTYLGIQNILLYGLGFEVRGLTFKTELVRGVQVREGSDNPFLIDNDGNKQYFQRPLVWDEADKVALIDSMYNNVDIGKFVIVRRDYQYIEKQIKLGNTDVSFHELVDGKQRINAICEFMQDKFKDSYGNYYSEYDTIYKRNFWQYNKCGLAILEDPTPAQIKYVFLNVNYTGKVMTKEHIEFIKSLNV